MLDSVRYGVANYFINIPEQKVFTEGSSLSKEMSSICDQEIKQLLGKEAIVEVSPSSDCFISKIFVIRKKSGGFNPKTQVD